MVQPARGQDLRRTRRNLQGSRGLRQQSSPEFRSDARGQRCESINLPGTSRSACRIVPVSDSVM
jgi:hypothetical protein